MSVKTGRARLRGLIQRNAVRAQAAIASGDAARVYWCASYAQGLHKALDPHWQSPYALGEEDVGRQAFARDATSRAIGLAYRAGLAGIDASPDHPTFGLTRAAESLRAEATDAAAPEPAGPEPEPE